MAADTLNKPTHTRLIVLTICAIVLLTGIAMYVANAQRAWNEAHAESVFPVEVRAEELSENSTRIPVQVVGVDLDEKDVNKVFYIGGDTDGIELRRGRYEISIPASPLTPNGILYEPQEEYLAVSVGPEGADGASQGSDSVAYTPLSDGETITLSLSSIPAEEVTDEQIDAALQFALNDEESAGVAEEYANTMREVRDTAVEEKRLEEEELRAKEEAEAKRTETAVGFARAYYTTVEITGPDDSLENLKNIDRNAAAIEFTDPSSHLYTELANPSYDNGGRGVVEAASLCKDVEVVSVSDDYIVMDVTWAGTQNDIPGWTEQSVNVSRITVEMGETGLVSDFTWQ